MPKIIAFTGKKQSGKTTSAGYLIKQYKFTPLNFKDALVQEMRDSLPETLRLLSDMYDTTTDGLFKEKPLIMRKLMQEYGYTRRQDDEDYWVDKWMVKSLPILQTSQVVADDCRYSNELDIVQCFGGVVIRIERNTDTPSADNHPSETEMDTFSPDYIIENNGTIIELHNKLEEVYQSLLK